MGPQPGDVAPHSEHARTVARWFDISLDEVRPPAVCNVPVPLPAPGQIMLIVGPSGAGKSSLLRELRNHAPQHTFRDVAQVTWRTGVVIDQFGDDIESALAILGRFGLGEAHTYLCPPTWLSDGQLWRLRLARVVHDSRNETGAILVADEFAAVLDRLTASVVARALRRAISAHPVRAAIVATSHDDLERALAPDIIVRCDFGRVTVENRSGPSPGTPG